MSWGRRVAACLGRKSAPEPWDHTTSHCRLGTRDSTCHYSYTQMLRGAHQVSLKTVRRVPARCTHLSVQTAPQLVPVCPLNDYRCSKAIPHASAVQPPALPSERPEAGVARVGHPRFPRAHVRVLDTRPQQPPLHQIRRLQVLPPSGRRVQGLQEVVPARSGGNAPGQP